MASNHLNDPVPPAKPGEEEVPLIPLSQSQRAKHLSQLSLQSQGSDILEAAYGDIENGGVSVSLATIVHQREFLSNFLKARNSGQT